MRAVIFSASLALVTGHGAMNFPRPRNSDPSASWSADASCVGQACFWYQVGCFIGCDECTGTGKYLYPAQSDFPAGCKLATPTNNARETRTWFGEDGDNGDFTKYNPWRAPGLAPVRDSCGASSGYKEAGSGPYAPEVPKGYPVWSKGSEVLKPTTPTVWKAGGTAEVSWAIAAQHGGGYSCAAASSCRRPPRAAKWMHVDVLTGSPIAWPQVSPVPRRAGDRRRVLPR